MSFDFVARGPIDAATQTEDLNRLNVVHITGTKGKGSTCAFTDSILRHVKPDWKIGERSGDRETIHTC